MIKLTDLLNEIGEGVTPFPWTSVGSTKISTWLDIMSKHDKSQSTQWTQLPSLKYQFNGDKSSYIVEIQGEYTPHTYINWGGKNPGAKKPHDYSLVIGVAFNTAEGERGDEQITNFNEQFKVISTVTDITLDVANELMGVDWIKLTEIHIAPKLEDYEEGKPIAQTKRGRIYLEYIKKQGSKLPGNWTAAIENDRFVLYNSKISSLNNPDKYIELQ